MNDPRGSGQALATPPGLCGTCRHAATVVTSRGSRFVRCERSATDPRYPRYPTLPVRRCPGYEAAAADR